FINDYIVIHKETIVMPPYPEIVSGQDTLILLFHHMNLIHMYYINKDFFSSKEWEGIERWIDKVFFRWIGCNNEIFSDFRNILELGDYYQSDFINWLKSRDAMKFCEQGLSPRHTN